jgi:hypothetical protein
MKTKRFIWVGLSCAAVIWVIAALAQPSDLKTKSVRVTNNDNIPFFTGLCTGTQTANLFELWANPATGPAFYVPATGILPSALCGIESGTNKMTGTSVTNSFPVAYASVPRVQITGSDSTVVYGVTNLTTTNFVLVASATNGIATWMAVAQ